MPSKRPLPLTFSKQNFEIRNFRIFIHLYVIVKVLALQLRIMYVPGSKLGPLGGILRGFVVFLSPSR
jgi:hypothetical protein